MSERGSTVSRELRGGLVRNAGDELHHRAQPADPRSFAADGSGAKADITGAVLGIPQVAAVTALVAGLMTLLFGLVANYPFAIATGLGINTLVAVTIAPLMTWPESMVLVVVNGLVIVLLAVSGFAPRCSTRCHRSSRPRSPSASGCSSRSSGSSTPGSCAGSPTPRTPRCRSGWASGGGAIASWPTAVFGVGLLITSLLVARGVRAGILIGVAATTGIAIVRVGPSMGTNPQGWALSVPALPDSVPGVPDLSLVGAVSFGAFARLDIVTVVLLVFTLVRQLLRRHGHDDRAGQAGRVRHEGRAAAERRSRAGRRGGGARAGGGRGADHAENVSERPAGPWTTLRGRSDTFSDRRDRLHRVPGGAAAFLTIVVMPFTYSIANGIGAGFVSWVLLAAATGRVRTVHPLMWVVSVAFVAFFAVGPILLAGS